MDKEARRPQIVAPNAYDPEGSILVRLRAKEDIVTASEVQQKMTNDAAFIAIWTNGATKDLCFASSVRNYLKVRLHQGKLVVSSRDAQLLSACHLWSFAPNVEVFHIEVDGPFLFGDDAVCGPKLKKSPSELLNELFVLEDGTPLNIPWASHIFNGLLRDSEMLASGRFQLDPKCLIADVMEEARTRWNSVAERQYDFDPDCSICVNGIGSRGFYIPPSVAGAERSRANKK